MFIYATDDHREILVNAKRVVEAYSEDGKFYILYELGDNVQTAELNININSLRELQKILNS